VREAFFLYLFFFGCFHHVGSVAEVARTPGQLLVADCFETTQKRDSKRPIASFVCACNQNGIAPSRILLHMKICSLVCFRNKNSCFSF
jgi:hypothetical protein